jgi:hypothetical protein
MTVDAAMLEEARGTVAALPPTAGPDLTAIPDLETLYAYVATASRAEDPDEADMVELVARLTDARPDELRRIARVLEPRPTL